VVLYFPPFVSFSFFFDKEKEKGFERRRERRDNAKSEKFFAKQTQRWSALSDRLVLSSSAAAG